MKITIQLFIIFEVEKYGLVIQLEHHKMKKLILIHIPNLLVELNL